MNVNNEANYETYTEEMSEYLINSITEILEIAEKYNIDSKRSLQTYLMAFNDVVSDFYKEKENKK